MNIVDVMFNVDHIPKQAVEACAAILDDVYDARIRLLVVADDVTAQQWHLAAHSKGFEVHIPTEAEQRTLLEQLDASWLARTDRRNLAHLLAWSSGAAAVISVGEQHLPSGSEFIADHLRVIKGARTHRIVESGSGWWNPCDLLDIEPVRPYPRGFPYRHRHPATTTEQTAEADIRVNVGLWLGDPDVDPITQVTVPLDVHDLVLSEAVLGPRTWAPLSLANAAVHVDLLPAYFLPPIRRRHAEVLAGYFLQACLKHLGHAVRFGTPLVVHERLAGDPFQDLRDDLHLIAVLDDLLDWLWECRLEGATPAEVFRSLSFELADAVEGMTGSAWTRDMRGQFHRTAHLMRRWAALLARTHP